MAGAQSADNGRYWTADGHAASMPVFPAGLCALKDLRRRLSCPHAFALLLWGNCVDVDGTFDDQMVPLDNVALCWSDGHSKPHHSNKPLDEMEKTVYARRARKVAAVEIGVVAIAGISGWLTITRSIAISFGLSAMVLMLGKLNVNKQIMF